MEISKVRIIMTIKELKTLKEFLGSLSTNDHLNLGRTEEESKILDQIYFVLADSFND